MLKLSVKLGTKLLCTVIYQIYIKCRHSAGINISGAGPYIMIYIHPLLYTYLQNICTNLYIFSLENINNNILPAS